MTGQQGFPGKTIKVGVFPLQTGFPLLEVEIVLSLVDDKTLLLKR